MRARAVKYKWERELRKTNTLIKVQNRNIFRYQTGAEKNKYPYKSPKQKYISLPDYKLPKQTYCLCFVRDRSQLLITIAKPIGIKVKSIFIQKCHSNKRKLFATQSSFTDCLKHKIVNKAI